MRIGSWLTTVASDSVSVGETTLPGVRVARPILPSMGEMMSVYPRLISSIRTAACAPSSEALEVRSCAWALSSATWVPAPVCRSSRARCRETLAFSNCAWAEATLARDCSSAASKGARSMRNSTLPAFTSWPSWKARSWMKPVMRARMSTRFTASIRPVNSELSVTGRRSALATPTAGGPPAPGPGCAFAAPPNSVEMHRMARAISRIGHASIYCGARCARQFPQASRWCCAAG